MSSELSPIRVFRARTAATLVVIAAIVWLCGLPAIAAVGVIPGSDAPYLWQGLVGVLLGFTLSPGAAIGIRHSQSQLIRIASATGLLVCAMLASGGILLIIGAAGGLGNRAPSWLVPVAETAWLGLFLWMLLASIAARDGSALGQTMFLLGITAVAAVTLMLVESLALFYLLPGFVFTGATLVPTLVFGLLIWLCPGAWFVCLALLILRRMQRAGS